MLDIKWIRDNPAALDAALAARRTEPQAAAIVDLDQRRRRHQTEFQELQARRNDASKAIGQAKGKGQDASALIAEVADLKGRIAAAEEAERQAGEALEALLAAIPNVPQDDVPRGPDETGNVEVRRHGSPRNFAFTPRDHVAIGEALGQMDFEAAARISGARFVVLRRDLARLERAIGNFMLDLHTGTFGYQEVSPPLLVRDEAVYGVGQLPKFAEDLFRTTNGYWLIPTAEVSLTNLVREQITAEY
jgi:seryl-tRNA synthetase